ncbi:restriction modification system DNA specificity domain-containing protein [Nitrosomonas sp. Is79A3] [Mycobacterium shimoidei]|uniref:Restriction modification system DNA specificity domain-containing protein [Nitrosomonas sp. Is79A3] n=1 Tax=Mycobacterium shimoidei TaxID=29313 RepID=A0A375Z041_MYCSH|nr:restriction endonuclease subunit S [Mycobacterium shimoidei]SRX94508.1 restriction modification system DNA specificity domain-containing protein [Nitrosomonas sp. Is79A3] [Mycobacterium shimoidei]
MNYSAYPEYCASALNGDDMVRSGWKPIRLRHILKLNPLVPKSVRKSMAEVTFLPMEAIGEDGSLDISRERPVQQLLDGYSYFENGDVLFAKVTPCFENGKFATIQGLSSGFGFGTTEVTTLRPGAGLDQRFLGYIVRTDLFKQAGIAAMTGAGGLKRVPDEHVRNFRVALPPMDEQRIIVDFLDHETAKIDALIAKQEQLIATLREDRIATITHAVTKGLDPNAEMKDSGVEWLGEIPAHWEASRLKFVVKSVDSGTSVNAGDWTPSADEIGILKTSCVSTGRFNAAGSKTVVDPEEIGRVTCPVRGGSLIVNRANTPQLVGSTGYAAEDYPNLYLSDKLWQVRLRSASAKFIHLWSQTEAYRSQIAAKCVGASSSMQNLSMGDFRDIAFGLPPMPEQQLIVEYLDAHCAKLDALIAKSEQMIGALREYRSALITDAVTGKIDVRGAA